VRRPAPRRHNTVGAALLWAQRFDEVLAASREAAAIFRQTGDRNSEGIALVNVGAALVGTRRSEHAITAWQEAAAIFRETGDRQNEDVALAYVERIQPTSAAYSRPDPDGRQHGRWRQRLRRRAPDT
jgi:hypothetical protein